MFKKLILLTSIIAIFATACNKEDSPLPDSTVEIESQENSINLRGGGFGPTLSAADVAPYDTEEEVYIGYDLIYENEDSIPTPLFIDPENPCSSNFKTFELKLNSANANAFEIGITNIVWESNGETNLGTKADYTISTNQNQTTNIKCSVIVMNYLRPIIDTIKINFDAWSNNGVLVVENQNVIIDAFCPGNTQNLTGPGAVVAIFP